MSDPAPDLQKQYELVLQDYRFQVQLNWDRAKHYLVFNTAIFGAAVALGKDAKSWVPEAGVAVLLLIACGNSFAGQRSVASGHEYYQSIRGTKTKLEKALGLDGYEIASTPGMKREHDAVPAGTPGVGLHRLTKITTQIRALLAVICIFAAAGSACATVAAYQDFGVSAPPACPSGEHCQH